MNLSDIKIIFDMIIGSVPFLKTILKGVKSLVPDRLQASEAAQKSLETVVETMSGPDRDKIDAERVRALAELTRSTIPFAFVEYLFSTTKLFGVLALLMYMHHNLRRDRKAK